METQKTPTLSDLRFLKKIQKKKEMTNEVDEKKQASAIGHDRRLKAFFVHVKVRR